MRARTTRTTRVAVAVTVQLGLVAVAVWAPLVARITGEEVLLRVAPVDTWQLTDDAYLDLDYTDLPTDEHYPSGDVTEEEVRRLEAEHGPAFVPLTREGGVWVGGDVVREEPPGGLFLRCDDSGWVLRCGIERAYLSTSPENDAVRDALRAGAALAAVRVDGAGHAALMGLSVAP